MRSTVVPCIKIIALSSGDQPPISDGLVEDVGLTSEYKAKGGSKGPVIIALAQQPELRNIPGYEVSVILCIGKNNILD